MTRPTRESTFETVAGIVANIFNIEAGNLNEQTRLHQDLGGDSLDDIEVIVQIEEILNMVVPEAQAEPLATHDAPLDDLVALVHNIRLQGLQPA